MNPEGVSPETKMPNLNLDKKDAQAQTMLVMSWKRVNLPLAYIHMRRADAVNGYLQRYRNHRETGAVRTCDVAG
jgi:hypothetical protein